MRDYETMFILNPELKEAATEEIISKIKSTITENKGEINEIDQWGSRELAYEIDNFAAGYYTVINFSGQSVTVNELERVFGLADNLLRFIILRDE